MIDHDILRKDPAKEAGISNFTITKMGKGENVTVDTLCKICAVLDCKIDDIIEFTVDEEEI